MSRSQLLPHRQHLRDCSAVFARGSAVIRRRFSWWLVVVGLWLASGCNTAAPLLLNVQQVQPRALAARDVLELFGDGFVAGAAGRLTLEGKLYRAGHAPQEVRVELDARGVSSTRAEARFPSAVVERWCASPDGPVHVTFRGRVSLAFRPQTLGAPPLVGELGELVLDVYPEPTAPAEALLARVETLQRLLGWELRETPAGVVVERVEPGGAAFVAGLRDGDRLLEYAGVAVTSLSDLAPYAGQREATLRVRPPKGGQALEVSLDVRHVNPLSAAAWKWAWVLVGVAAVSILISRSPLAYLLAWVESRAAKRPEARRPNLPRLVAPPKTRLRRLPRGFSAFLGVSLLFAALAWRVYPLELDLLWAYLCGVVLWCLSGLLQGGIGSRWSLWRGLLTVVRQLPVVVITAACLAATLLERGSVQLADVVRRDPAQPAMHLLASLPEHLAALVLLACAMLLAMRQDVRRARSGARVRLAVALSRWLDDAHLLVLGGLFLVLFLGGWGVYGLDGVVEAPARSTVPSLIELLTFEAKLVGWYVGLVWLRHRRVQLPHASAERVLWRHLLPASVTALLLVPVWSAPAWPAWLREATLAIAGVITLSWSLLALARWGWVRRRQVPLTAINPWL